MRLPGTYFTIVERHPPRLFSQFPETPRQCLSLVPLFCNAHHPDHPAREAIGNP